MITTTAYLHIFSDGALFGAVLLSRPDADPDDLGARLFGVWECLSPRWAAWTVRKWAQRNGLEVVTHAGEGALTR